MWNANPWKDDSEDENQKLEEEMVYINNFWKPDIRVKNVRFSEENLERYKIPDFDLDKDIKKIFNEQKTI